MMPDLRSRLKAVAKKQNSAPVPVAECLRLEYRTSLSEMPGLLDTTAEHVRRLGLEMPTWDVRRALFIDTETTGLRGAGTVAFLVGLGWVEGDEFIVCQLLMRDYPEEVHQMEQVADFLERFDCAVSFNGKSFDLPLLRDRFTMARLRDRWRDLPQLDLLHATRRTWRLRLGACNLGAVEEAVLGIVRENDLPGAEVPERYFRYLKCGDFSLLEDVLRHNEQDIRSLGVLLARLAQVYEQPTEQTSMLDVFSVGRALDKTGDGELARRCYRVASVSELSQQARLHLAKSYRHEKDFIHAAETYQDMISRGEADAQVYVALAILLERYLGKPGEALAVTEKALWRFSGGDFLHKADRETLAALEGRRMRLKRRIERNKTAQGG